LSGKRLMKTPPQFVLSRLSRELYAEFLTKAKAGGFSFVHFHDFLPGGPVRPRRYIALPHDIDFAPKYSVEMAELTLRFSTFAIPHALQTLDQPLQRNFSLQQLLAAAYAE